MKHYTVVIWKRREAVLFILFYTIILQFVRYSTTEKSSSGTQGTTVADPEQLKGRLLTRKAARLFSSHHICILIILNSFKGVNLVHVFAL